MKSEATEAAEEIRDLLKSHGDKVLANLDGWTDTIAMLIALKFSTTIADAAAYRKLKGTA